MADTPKPVSYTHLDVYKRQFLGRDYADHQDYSEETARRIDVEVQRIMRQAHERAEKILTDHREQLELMAQVLLERETVEGKAVEALLGGRWDEFVASEGVEGEAPSSSASSRKPKQSDEEIAAAAAAFAEAAVAAERSASDASVDAPPTDA